MESRDLLGKKLRAILGSKNVYFQPPSSVKMHYPAIVYKISADEVRYADDRLYYRFKCYDVTYIDYDPDSPIPDRIREEIPYCSYNGHFVSDNLNHHIFKIYF